MQVSPDIIREAGHELRRLRRQHGYTGRDVERISNREIKQAWLSKAERGALVRPPNSIYLASLASLYGTDLQILESLYNLPTSLSNTTITDSRVLKLQRAINSLVLSDPRREQMLQMVELIVQMA